MLWSAPRAWEAEGITWGLVAPKAESMMKYKVSQKSPTICGCSFKDSKFVMAIQYNCIHSAGNLDGSAVYKFWWNTCWDFVSAGLCRSCHYVGLCLSLIVQWSFLTAAMPYQWVFWTFPPGIRTIMQGTFLWSGRWIFKIHIYL